MGFEDLLRKKLGPMRDLVARRSAPDLPAYDPAALWYRRAVGLEVRVRPDETWAEVEIGRVDRPTGGRRRPVDEADAVLGMTAWTQARDLGVRPATLWRWVEEDLLFFARSDPNAPLAGGSGVLARLAPGQAVARRRAVWPTAAVETPFAIAPIPFMPRTSDLERAVLAGFRFASLERGFEVLGATITGHRRTGEHLRRLLPLLDGRSTPEAIARALPAALAPETPAMLGLLDRLTLLEPASGPPPPAASLQAPSRPQVTWLGHAAVLVQAHGLSLLFDPLFFSASTPEERWAHPPKFDPRALPALDAIFITHGDNDHCNASALSQLPPTTPIYIPRVGDRPAPYQVDMRRLLTLLGFERVVELEPGAGVAVGDVLVTACAFEGESWDLPLAKLTYLVESEDLAVYLAADSGPMDETYRQLACRARRVDLAFMGVSGCAETFVMPDGFGYGNFYREWVPRVRHNEWVLHCAGPEEAAHSLSILRPRFAFGYAAGGASFIRTEYSDTGDHDQLAAALERRRTQHEDLDTRPVALPLGVPVDLEALKLLPKMTRSG